MPLDDQTPTIDLAAYVKSRFAADGAEVAGPGDQPGTLVIKTPVKMEGGNTGYTGQQMTEAANMWNYTTVDQNKIIQDGGGNPAQVKVQLGTTDQPLNENPLGFVDRVKFALAGEKENKQKLLEDTVGKENATYNDKTGQFLVKKDNAVYNVTNPGTGAALAADAPVIAAGTAGGIIGTILAPGIGTAAGVAEGAAAAGAIAAGTSIAGGAIGTGLGRIGTIEAAHEAGIRDKVDWDQAKNEVGKEMLWTAAFGAAPYVASGAGLLGEAATGKALQKLDSVIENPTARASYANIVGGMTETDPAHIMAAVNNPEEWTTAQKLNTKWENQRIANAGTGTEPEGGSINPLKLKMANDAQGVLDRGWQQAKKAYSDFVNQPEVQAAVDEARVDLKPLTKVSDTNPTPIKQMLIEQQRAIGDSIPTESNMLKKTIADLQAAEGVSPKTVKGGPEGLLPETQGATKSISYADAKELQDRVRNILYSQGPQHPEALQVSSRTQRVLTMYDQALSAQLNEGLTKQSENVAQGMLAANAEYGSKKGLYQAIGARKAFEPNNIDATLSKLSGPKGERLRENLTQFLTKPDDPAVQDLLRKVDINNSVLNTSKLFQGSGVMRTSMNLAGKAAAKITPAMIGTIQRLGKVVQFVSQVPEAVRTEMFNNPYALNALVQGYAQSFQIENQTRDQLTNQAVQTGQQTMPPYTPPNQGRSR